MKKVIIFDMDGVLFDTIPYAREVFMSRHPGLTEEMYNEIHHGNFHDMVKKYSHLKIKETEEEKIQHQINYAKEKSKASMFPGISELLERLHSEGYILVLNTNAYNRNCVPLLENAGILNKFDYIASAEVSKDKVEKFKLIKEKYSENVLFITDALGDVRDADTANVPTIAVTWGVHGEQVFKQEPHKNLICVANTVDDLLSCILKNT